MGTLSDILFNNMKRKKELLELEIRKLNLEIEKKNIEIEMANSEEY